MNIFDSLSISYDLVFAIVTGVIPALLWLWFWLHEDSQKPEPKGLIFLLFLMGMVSVYVVIPIQKSIGMSIDSGVILITIWAAIEEITKYFSFLLMSFKNPYLDEPVDYPIYMITVALGFVALENTLFIFKTYSESHTAVSLLTGNLRFIGASVLHVASSAVVGLSMGFSSVGGFFQRKISLLFGLMIAIALHTVFNFFIIQYKEEKIFVVFGLFWVVAVIIMLLFEKLKQMN